MWVHKNCGVTIEPKALKIQKQLQDTKIITSNNNNIHQIKKKEDP